LSLLLQNYNTLATNEATRQSGSMYFTEMSRFYHVGPTYTYTAGFDQLRGVTLAMLFISSA